VAVIEATREGGETMYNVERLQYKETND